MRTSHVLSFLPPLLAAAFVTTGHAEEAPVAPVTLTIYSDYV